MKRIILGLLLAAITPPASAQTLEDFYTRGQKDAFLTCYLISQGYTDMGKIKGLINQSLDQSQQMLMEIVSYQLARKDSHQSNKKDNPALEAYANGFIESISICGDEFGQLMESTR